MVGCKDRHNHNPAHTPNSTPSLPLSLAAQNASTTSWLDALPQTFSPFTTISHSTSTSTSTFIPHISTAHDAPYFLRPTRPNSANPAHPSTTTSSSKRKVLANIQNPRPRKSARLNQRPSIPKGNMLQSPLKNKDVRAKAKEREESGMVTRGRSKAKVFLAGSIDKENGGTVRSAGIETQVIPLFSKPSARPGSPLKSKSSSSRPGSPTKSTSTKAPAPMTKRERLMLLNPPVGFFPRVYFGDLGKKMPPAVKILWVDHIESDDEGIIPEALKARIPQQTPNKSKPKVPTMCFSDNTRYKPGDFERIWITMMDVLKNANRYRHEGYHESHWISYVISPMLNLVSNLECFNKDGKRIKALDIQSVAIDPPSLCSYSPSTHFKDLDKRIDCAFGLDLPTVQTNILQRGVYDMKDAIDSINQTSSFVNFTPMFANFEVKRKNTDIDPLIQLAAWISAEFEKRTVEDYSLDMPTLAIEIEGDEWGLHIVYADREMVNEKGYGLRFVGPMSLGDTKSLQGGFKLLDGLCRCAEWGVGSYKSWFKEQILQKYE